MQRKIFTTTIIFLFLSSVILFARSVGNLYQDGLHKEETLGDLNAAIESYSKAVEMQQQNRQIAAQAQLRIGFCYEKLGKETEAEAAFQKVLKMFSEQEEVVKLLFEIPEDETDYFYFAKDVGLIKMTGPHGIWELKEYSLAPAREAREKALSDGHPYFPLAVGNRWIYEYSDRDTHDEKTMELISKQEDAEGTTWYRVGECPWAERDVIHWGVKDDGLFMWGIEPNQENIIPMLVSPIEPGRKWEYKFKYARRSEGKEFQILSTKDVMTTPAGTFEEVIKLQVESPREGETVYFYFAKGVGLIKMTGGGNTLELKEYSLTPAQRELTLRIFEPVMGLPGLMMLGEEFVTKEELCQKLQEAGEIAILQIIAHQSVTRMQLKEIMELAKGVGIDKLSKVVPKPGTEKPYGFGTPADAFRSLQIFIENGDWESVRECFVQETPPPLDEESQDDAGVLERKYGTHITHVEQFGDEAIVMVRMIGSMPKVLYEVPTSDIEIFRKRLIEAKLQITLPLPASLQGGRWFFKAKYTPDWAPPREALRNLGFILDDEWMLMGPFYMPPGGLENSQEVLSGTIEELLSQWIQEPFNWSLVDDGKLDAYVDLSTQWLDKETPNLKNARKQVVKEEKDYWSAYAIAYIQSPDDRDVKLNLRSSGRCRVWYDGDWLGDSYRNSYKFNPLEMVSETHGRIIHLKRGINPVVVLVGREIWRTGDAWGIIGRLSDLEGRPMRDLKFLPAKDYYIYPTFFEKLGY